MKKFLKPNFKKVIIFILIIIFILSVMQLVELRLFYLYTCYQCVPGEPCPLCCSPGWNLSTIQYSIEHIFGNPSQCSTPVSTSSLFVISIIINLIVWIVVIYLLACKILLIWDKFNKK